ncbi:MAG: AAA domain-containing protein [Candidatus Lokiarchaeota archaeon]|nr:AAA domain-containing protein [Candidatus Lokiarchaeota archaeon]MBD3353982.1 AAA domain-containing protein [Candidatus Lokiarchaeota archaeon]
MSCQRLPVEVKKMVMESKKSSEIAAQSSFYATKQLAAIEKLKRQKSALQQYFKERDEIVETMFLCVLSQQHQIQVGPPGTAKSALIESFTKGFDGFSMFSYQLSKFSTPEELFGPFDLNELKRGNYTRKSSGMMQDSEIVYVDEVFNANSSVLNKCNSLMNERTFEGKSAALQSLFGATNFLPEESNLVAYFDRFLFRHLVKYIGEPNTFKSMLQLDRDFLPNKNDVIHRDEIKDLQVKLHEIDVSGIIDKIVRIREELREDGICPSDRRFRWALIALKASALIDAREVVTEEDLFVLKHILWGEKEHVSTIEQTIARIVQPALAEIKTLMSQAHEMCKSVKAKDPKKPDELALIMETLEKLNKIKQEIEEIINSKNLSKKVLKVAEKILKEIVSEGQRIQKDKMKAFF